MPRKIRIIITACCLAALGCFAQGTVKELGYGVREDAVLRTLPPRDDDAVLPPFSAVLVTPPAHGTATVNADGSFTYTPEPEFCGGDSLVYVPSDGSTTALPVSVRIVVVPVNDAPSFLGGPDQNVSLASGAQSVPNWASQISAGPANEAGQALMFLVANDNPSLFAEQPGVSSSGELTYTAAGDVTGVANVMVMLRDNGGTTSGGQDTSAPHVFTITIHPPAEGRKAPRIERIRPSAAGCAIEFATEKDVSYLIQSTEDFVNWETAAAPVAGTGERVQWNDVPRGAMRFYRLLLAP